MPLPIKIQQSKNILSGTTATSIKIKVIYTGTIRFFVSQDSITWTEIENIVSSVYNIVTFTSSGSSLYWKAVGLNGGKILNTTTLPGIYIEKLS